MYRLICLGLTKQKIPSGRLRKTVHTDRVHHQRRSHGRSWHYSRFSYHNIQETEDEVGVSGASRYHLLFVEL
jgi:hypothetical protein